MNRQFTSCADIQKPRTDEARLWDILFGHAAYRALLVAYDLKFFPLLGKKPHRLAEISEALNIHCRPAKAILDVLVSIELVQVKDGYYSLTLLAEDYLVESSPTYFGGMLDIMLINTHTVASVDSLKKAVLTNSPQLYHSEKPFNTHEEQVELARTFTYAMHGHSIAPALVWPELIDLSKYKLLLDIGGGSGAHAIGATLKWSQLQATVLDMLPVCEIAKEFAQRYGLQSRIKTHTSDMWKDPFPAADIHFYADIYHDWLPEQGSFLTQKSFDSLPSGGRIIIHEMLYNESKTGPFTVAAYNMGMLVTMEGQQYSGSELSEMLAESGFADIEVKRTLGYWSIVTGCKP
ncbi:methyltransferase [Microcoleus sp. F6_B4]